MQGTVLVVDDHVQARRALASELKDAGFLTIEAGDGADAWDRFRENTPDVVVTDMIMPRRNGLDLLSKIRSRSDVPVILFTARGSVKSAALAFKAGADDFVSSPDVDIDEIVTLVSDAVRGRRSTREISALESRILGKGRNSCRLRERISGLAPLREPILVSGEPRSGHTSTARALHEFGSSSDGQFTLVPAEIFSPGDDLPESGALHLDAIDSLSSEAEKFWIAWFHSKASRRFRLIASTTSAPQERALRKSSIPTLLSLLSRFSIELPTARMIRSDLPEISESMITQIGNSFGRNLRLSPSAVEFVVSQDWPGNLRQLEEVLERAASFTRGRILQHDVIEEAFEDLRESLERIRMNHAVMERDTLVRTIRETGGNISRTAAQLRKSRSAIYRLIQKHGLRIPNRQ